MALVILLLGTNDLQITHQHTAWHAAQGMPIPPILVVVPPLIGSPQWPIAAKFIDGAEKSAPLAALLAEVCEQQDCYFFDAKHVVTASLVDGIHLDAPEHRILAQASAEK